MSYALIPHGGDWQHAALNKETIQWNEPLIINVGDHPVSSNSFIKAMDPGLEISAMYYKGSDMYIRIMNTGSLKSKHYISLNCSAKILQFVDLNDKIAASLKLNPDKPASFNCNIPLFGFKTIRISGAKPE